MKLSNLKQWLIFVLCLFYLPFTFAQDAQNLNKTKYNPTNYEIEYQNKMKLKAKQVQPKPELKSSTNVAVVYTANKAAVLKKIAYLKEQNCCEEEIKELEGKLED